MFRRLISCILLLLTLATTASAQQLVTDGFYRARNGATKRYITVIDGYGAIDIQSTSVDVGAIRTWKNDDEHVISNPGSIIYSQYNAGNGYKFKCQGTDTYAITGVWLEIRQRGSYYQLYATKQGMTMYLGDNDNRDRDSSYVEAGVNYNLTWETLPVTTTGDNYFGVLPQLQQGGAYWASFYAAFPFACYSEGMQAYYVSMVDADLGIAVWDKVEGDVAASVPVIIKCASASPSQNRLDLHQTTAVVPAGNLLKGTYFCRYEGQKTNPHRAVVNNDTATMRVLGLLPDGSLGMKKCNGLYIPKNTAYLVVKPGTPDELRLMTREEYEAAKPKPVESVTLSDFSVELRIGETYTLTAQVLPENAADKTLSWTSSDPTTVSVLEGKLTALKEGQCSITAAAQDRSGRKASCTVTVKPVMAERITLDKTSAEVLVGESLQLAATVEPENTTTKTVRWSSSDETVLTVSQTGLVQTLGVGRAVVTVHTQDGSDLSDSCIVTVKPILVEEICLSATILTTIPGQTFQLTADIYPANATNQELAWSSSDRGVAQVSQAGLVTVLGGGSCFILCSATDGSGVTARCEVTSVDGVETLQGRADDIVVRDLSGRLVGQGREALDRLPRGIYLVNGRKMKK